MNPGPWLAIVLFCLAPALTIGLSFWAGVRYARYGWKGILPKSRTQELFRGTSLLSSDH